MSTMFGWGVGDILAISQLAMKVSAAYKDAPNDYKHLSDEVSSLEVIINRAVQCFQRTTLSDKDQQDGQNVLKGCQSVLEDLNSLIDNYTSSKTRQAFKKVMLESDDIGALRVRLISNTGLLNGFIQR